MAMYWAIDAALGAHLDRERAAFQLFDAIRSHLCESKRPSLLRVQSTFIQWLAGINSTSSEPLASVNKFLEESRQPVYVPFARGTEQMHVVIRLPPEEVKVFASKTAPTLVVAEVLVHPKRTFSDKHFDRKCFDLAAKVRRAKAKPDKANSRQDGWPLSELWAEKKERVRRQSPYGGLRGWDLTAMIVKRDDCTREAIAVSLIETFQEIFEQEHVDMYLRPYRIFVCSKELSLIELLPDVISVSGVHKAMGREPDFRGASNLTRFFIRRFGDRDTATFRAAQRNFVRSLAAYSLVSYLLQLKDRHNENIMLDLHGHIVHIDFGYCIDTFPGGKLMSIVGPAEPAFKLTKEYLHLIGDQTHEFKSLMVEGFLAVRKHYSKIWWKLNMFSIDSDAFHDRFKLALTDKGCADFIEQLIRKSLNHVGTIATDVFNRYFKNIG
eukprot:TRINITY_DN11486_c0_g1_i1.p1 TRINITY_DN11486_c0_g1~~TRINITY_DN11486_c0_g1_i1.p1  ORF type:complete len:509 (+),score=174.27 TRINITY_DN11486_c0_g1_i1:214-1527(+)